MKNPFVKLPLVVAASAVALVALRAASFVPMTDARGESGWVRLSWSARPERIEHCRRFESGIGRCRAARVAGHARIVGARNRVSVVGARALQALGFARAGCAVRAGGAVAGVGGQR